MNIIFSVPAVPRFAHRPAGHTLSTCRNVARPRIARWGSGTSFRARPRSVASRTFGRAPLAVSASGDLPNNGPSTDLALTARRVWGFIWRPLLLIWALVTFNVPFLLVWAANRQTPIGNVEVKKSDSEWREALSPAAYDVLIKRGTERSGTSPLNREKRPGMFCCAGCRAPLFDQKTKFESGTGWPSFWDFVPGSVDLTLQILYCLGDFGAREVRCHRCGGHLGHVFSDGPKPTGKRYCINGRALRLLPPASLRRCPETLSW